MPSYGASYHIHVSQVNAGLHPGLRVHVNRTRWVGNQPTVSGSVAAFDVPEARIDGGTPLEQAISCAELVLALLHVEQAQGELDATP